MSSFSGPVGGLGRQIAPSDSCFALATLVELFDQDYAAVADLLDCAMISIRRDLRAIETLARARDLQALIEAAHRIRGTSGSIGALSLIEISSRIEAAASGPAGRLPPPLLLELAAVVETLCDEIAAYALPAPEPD